MTPADADKPADGARTRDHLANERTLLSWVRLGLSASGFGFVVARFGLFLREIGHPSGPHRPGAFSEWVGIMLVLGGPVLVLLAAVRFFRTQQEIERGRYTSQNGLIVAVIAASVVLGLGLATYLFVSSR